MFNSTKISLVLFLKKFIIAITPKAINTPPTKYDIPTKVALLLKNSNIPNSNRKIELIKEGQITFFISTFIFIFLCYIIHHFFLLD